MPYLKRIKTILVLMALFLALPAQASEALLQAARAGSVTEIEQLVAAGARLESSTDRGCTPFILAAYHGHLQAAQTLAALGANACASDTAGSSALMGVAFKGHDMVAKWFVGHSGCDVNHTNQAGQTALMMASLFGREAMIDGLLEAGADPTLRDARGNTAESLARAQGLTGVVTKLRFVMQ